MEHLVSRKQVRLAKDATRDLALKEYKYGWGVTNESKGDAEVEEEPFAGEHDDDDLNENPAALTKGGGREIWCWFPAPIGDCFLIFHL